MKTAQWNAFQNALRCFRWISQSECRGMGEGGGVWTEMEIQYNMYKRHVQ